MAVAGGTGLVGLQSVRALRQAGHDAVVLARAVGVDLGSGDGLAAALVAVDAVIDVTNTPTIDPEQARAFFATTTGQLAAAEDHPGVSHHVGRRSWVWTGWRARAQCRQRAQERVALAGSVPTTTVRATQFFDSRREQVVTVPSLLVQPVVAGS